MSGRILVVDDVPTNRVFLKAKLSAEYYEVITLDSSEHVMETVLQEQPDMLLLDVLMPGKNGHEVCTDLKSDPRTAHIPVVMITADESPAERIKGLEAGADDFLGKPFDDLTLFARVRNLMRVKIMFDEMRLRDHTSRDLGLHEFLSSPVSRSDLTGHIVVAASSPTESYKWRSILGGHLDVTIREAGEITDVTQLRDEADVDVFIVHQFAMDGVDGLRLVSTLRSRPETRQSAIIFVMHNNDMKVAAAALDLGANDYVVFGLEPNEMVVRVRSQLRRKRYSDRLRSNVIDGLKMAVIDPLTGLYNRRYALQHLKSMSEKAHDDDAHFSILMIDLDEFKTVNDRFGHRVGDEVLCEFARRVQENVRGIDLVARLGGEEFCIAMPNTDTAQAAFVAERLRETIENVSFKINHERTKDISITASIGVASSDEDVHVTEDVLDRADQALFDAKNCGRNNVQIFSNAA